MGELMPEEIARRGGRRGGESQGCERKIPTLPPGKKALDPNGARDGPHLQYRLLAVSIQGSTALPILKDVSCINIPMHRTEEFVTWMPCMGFP
jgi:hypothetical protein